MTEAIQVPGLTSTPEEHLVGEGRKLLSGKGWSFKTVGENQLPVLGGMLIDEEDADASPIFHTVFLPKEGDSEYDSKRSVRGLRRFLNTMGVAYNKKDEFVVADINDKTGEFRIKHGVNKASDEMEAKANVLR